MQTGAVAGRNPTGTPAIMPGAEPFFFPAGETGCLLIHGFNGSPDCLRQMGRYLVGAGITAMGVRLHGHGTNMAEMERCHYRDWIASARAGLEELRRHCRIVFVAGISMGGSLSLYLARHDPDRIAGAIAMCTPYAMAVWVRILVPPLRRVIRRVTPIKRLGTRDPAVTLVGYPRISLSSAYQLTRLVALVRQDLPRVTCPVLVIASSRDQVVSAKNAPRILAALASTDKELFWVERSGHMVTLDYDRELVFQQAVAFIEKKALCLEREGQENGRF